MPEPNLTTEQQERLRLAHALIERANEKWNDGQYPLAAPLYQQALTLTQEVLGAEHVEVAGVLQNVANLYYVQEKYPEAEASLKHGLYI